MGKKATLAIPFLKEILDDTSFTLDYSRSKPSSIPPGLQAALALCKIGKPGFDAVLAALKAKDESVRRNVVEALGINRDKRAVDALIEALKDESWNVRRYATWSLGEIRDNQAVEALISILKDEDWHVRWQATEALRSMKDKRAVMPLVSTLKDGDRRVRENAAVALEEITGKRFGQDRAKWEDWVKSDQAK